MFLIERLNFKSAVLWPSLLDMFDVSHRTLEKWSPHFKEMYPMIVSVSH